MLMLGRISSVVAANLTAGEPEAVPGAVWPADVGVLGLAAVGVLGLTAVGVLGLTPAGA